MHSSVLLLVVVVGCVVCPLPLQHQVGDGLTAASKLSGYSGNYGLGGGLGGLTLNDMAYDLVGSFSMATRSIGVKLGLPLPENQIPISVPELTAIPSPEYSTYSSSVLSVPSPELTSVGSPELISQPLAKPELSLIPTAKVDLIPNPELLLKSLSLTNPDLTPIPTAEVNLIPSPPKLPPLTVLSPNIEPVHSGPLVPTISSYSTPTQSVTTSGYHWRKPLSHFKSFFHMGHSKKVLDVIRPEPSVVKVVEPDTHSILHPLPEPEVYKKPVQLEYNLMGLDIGSRLSSKLTTNPNFFTEKYNHWVSPHQKVSGYTSKVNHVSKHGYGESSVTFTQLHGLPTKKLMSWDQYDIAEPVEPSLPVHRPLLFESPLDYESALNKRVDLIGYGSQLTGSFGSVFTNGYNKFDQLTGAGLKGLEFPWKKKK